MGGFGPPTLMAVIVPQVIAQYGPPRTVVVRWVLNDGDEGEGFIVPLSPEKAVAVYGNFGAGGSILWEGTIDPVATLLSQADDPTKWNALKDVQLNQLSYTASGHDTVLDHVLKIAPRVTAGTGVTVDALLFVQKKIRS